MSFSPDLLYQKEATLLKQSGNNFINSIYFINKCRSLPSAGYQLIYF